MRRPHAIALGLLVALAAVHLAIVLSVARQPVGEQFSPAHRSVIWPLHHDTVHRAGPGADFFALYHAGVQEQRGQSPYDNHEKPRITPPFFPFRYLPVVAQTLGRTAAAMPPMTAYHAWIAVLELLLAASCVVLWRQPIPLPWRTAAIAALLLSSPYFLELHMGQFTFAASALLALGLLALDRSTRVASARFAAGTAAFAAAALLKVFPLASGAALVRHRRGLVAGAITGALVVAVTAPYFLAHADQWHAFATTNFGHRGTDGFHGGNYGCVYVMFLVARDLGRGAVRHFGGFAAVWQVAVLGATAAFVIWRKPSMLTGGLALMLAHMITYKLVWEHHASGIVLACAFLLIPLAGDRTWRGRWIALGCLILLALPTPFVFVDAHDPRVFDPTWQWSHVARYVLPMCKAVPTLALYVVACVQVHRERARAGVYARRG